MPAESIDRTVLPIRRPPFAGVTNRTLEGSEPDWNQAAHVRPPEGAPNVLLVLIDDAGFGNPSTFGGPIDTPNYTRMAEEGLRYNRFHVTAVCSPTRAAMLTGRNQHRVGFGLVSEFSGPFPGYNATIPRDCATLPRILQENGYMTGCFGKWHLTPDDQQGAAGPFNRWPNGLGFDYFWGFLGGEAGQYDPLIFENQKAIGVPESTDGSPTTSPTTWRTRRSSGCTAFARRVDDAVVRVRRDGLQPRTAPRPEGVVGQVQGQVRRGLGRPSREDVRAPEGAGRRPADAELTEPDEAFEKWDSLDETSKRLYARQMEVTRATRRTRTGTSAASSRRSRRWASSTTRSSSGSGATTAPAWREPSPARSTR